MKSGLECFILNIQLKYGDKIIENIKNIYKSKGKLGFDFYINNKKNNSGKISILYKNLEQFELISNRL